MPREQPDSIQGNREFELNPLLLKVPSPTRKVVKIFPHFPHAGSTVGTNMYIYGDGTVEFKFTQWAKPSPARLRM